jgi:hypothetical protein
MSNQNIEGQIEIQELLDQVAELNKKIEKIRAAGPDSYEKFQEKISLGHIGGRSRRRRTLHKKGKKSRNHGRRRTNKKARKVRKSRKSRRVHRR